jgi:hypothetical protein
MLELWEFQSLSQEHFDSYMLAGVIAGNKMVTFQFHSKGHLILTFGIRTSPVTTSKCFNPFRRGILILTAVGEGQCKLCRVQVSIPPAPPSFGGFIGAF